MDMTNKYYTPKIEEFRVGFEYERYYNGAWRSDMMGYNSQIPIVQLSARFRVKYLDQQDIEDCGFEHKFISNEYNGIKYYQFFNENLEMQAEYDVNKGLFNGLVRITHSIKWRMDECICFLGCIKNKSQLQDLLLMLNIK